MRETEERETVPVGSSSQITLGEALESSNVKPSEQTVACLRRLPAGSMDNADVNRLPANRLSAVLILLSLDDHGDLLVTLTTRALTLRTSPGETALPGGRCEAGEDVWTTALREANEEIGLPLGEPLVRLCCLPTFVSVTLLFVVPVVCFAPRSTLRNDLVASPAEVSNIFHVPLLSFLRGHQNAPRWTYQDVQWIEGRQWRLHSFDHGEPSPTTGLTAEICVEAALLATGQGAETTYDRHAEDQMSWSELVDAVLGGRAGDDRDKRSRRRPASTAGGATD